MSRQDLPLADFEPVACEICNQDSRTLVAQRTDLFLGGDVLYKMHECQGCGVVYQYPRPTQAKIMDFYPPDYQQYTPSVSKEKPLARFFRRYGLRKRCQIVTKYVQRGRLLDVGCATGDFLSEMRTNAGWEVIGVEPSHSAAQYAREQVGLEVVEGDLRDASFADVTFDAVTMWDVIEHVYDPRKVLSEISRLVRPGGVVVVNHPNLESIDRRIFGDLWLGYELPRHLYLFPTELLRQLMAQSGFSEVDRRCIYGSHAATCSSLMFVVEKRFGKGSISKVIRNILFSKIGRVILLPYFKLVDHFRLGSNVTAVFMKKN